MADEVLRERRGHVEILTINRPEARNAINRATAIALGDALDACESDDDVWVPEHRQGLRGHHSA